jgi:hypothetical protein
MNCVQFLQIVDAQIPQFKGALDLPHVIQPLFSMQEEYHILTDTQKGKKYNSPFAKVLSIFFIGGAYVEFRSTLVGDGYSSHRHLLLFPLTQARSRLPKTVF